MWNRSTIFNLLSLLAISSSSCQAAEYGVDCSFPIHYKEFRCDDFGDKQKQIYEDYMQGCLDHYGNNGSRCLATENERLQMSLRQPQSMVNYTSTGFMKIKAPKEVRELLSEHWERNKDKMEEENWPVGNIYTNHWAAPTYMVSVENQRLRGGGVRLKQKIWDAAKSTIEQWTGMELQPISMYGIRVYTEGAILSPHVDRLPLVSSAIVNVAQDVDEPWPLEVIDRFGNAVNVTMEPFDMVLYESGSLVHARPFPMKGRFYANIFIHFEPTGRKLGDNGDDYLDELPDFLPPYILPDSPEESNYRRHNPHGWKKPSPSAPIQQVFSPEGHTAAAHNDIGSLEKLAKKNKRMLMYKDKNGWQPLHEAVRGGHAEAAKVLIKHGADVNARTGHNGKGSSPLNLALSFHDESHSIVQYLREAGAHDIEPEL